MESDSTNYYMDDRGAPIFDVAYPPRYPECIPVGASTDFDLRSQYSQYDDTLDHVLDIVAPSNGGNWGIETTDITGIYGYDPGDYAKASGESGFGGASSSCPLAAGCAALLLSKNPNLNPNQIRDILCSTADKIGGVSYVNGYNKYYGYGRINIHAALNSIGYAVYHVPEEFPKIQPAIDQAKNGDHIIVSPGAYLENLNFLGKNITLRSTAPTSSTIVNTTLLSGSMGGVIVTFAGTGETSCVLSGFSIAFSSQGGIVGNGCEATIQNNMIQNNTAFGGPAIYQCHGLIFNNAISENEGVFGGALTECNGMIKGNSIWGNKAGMGGGIYLCAGTIESNIIDGNSSTSTGGGLQGCSGLIRNNTISFNSTQTEGGGLNTCNGAIENNRIFKNSSGEYGGGLSGCDGIIQNNLIYEALLPRHGIFTSNPLHPVSTLEQRLRLLMILRVMTDLRILME